MGNANLYEMPEWLAWTDSMLLEMCRTPNYLQTHTEVPFSNIYIIYLLDPFYQRDAHMRFWLRPDHRLCRRNFHAVATAASLIQLAVGIFLKQSEAWFQEQWRIVHATHVPVPATGLI